MKLQVNGKEFELSEGQYIPDLLAAIGLSGRPVVIELNRQALTPGEHAGQKLSEGDEVEIVSIVAGG